MPTLPVAPNDEAGSAANGGQRVAAAICRNVMAALGRPGDFLRITVRQVTSAGHRVNVVTGADASAARIAHSFFVTADPDGNLTGSTPEIVRRY